MNWIRLAPRARPGAQRIAYVPSFELLEERSLPSSGFTQTNLLSDVPGLAAITDPNLINPWGVSFAPNHPFWLADAGTGISTIYDNNSGTELSAAGIPGS